MTNNDESLVVDLGPGVKLHLTGAAAARLRATLVLPKAPSEGNAVLGDGDLMWEHHSGGDRSSGVPWSLPEALDDARDLRRNLPAKGSAFFELLISEPGRAFTSDEIIGLLREHFTSAHSIAGALNGFAKPCERTGRPFPFYWWEGTNGSPTRYAMRPSIALVFIAAGD
jgi:hypothetical protein